MFASFRRRVAASIERGDAAPGFALGVLCALLISIAFTTRMPAAVRADLAAYDLALAARRPRAAHPDLVLIEIDEKTIEGSQITRETYAKVLRALVDLGARQVGFDVEFGDRPGEDADPVLWLSRTEHLRKALQVADRGILGFRCNPQSVWMGRRNLLSVVVELLRRQPQAELDGELGRLGFSPDDRRIVEARSGDFWKLAVWILVDEIMSADPGTSYEVLQDKILRGAPKERSPGLLKEIETLRRGWLTLRASRDKGIPVTLRSAPREIRDFPIPSALYPDLAASARDLGFVVTPSHDIDGVLRRAPLVNLAFGQPRIYLGAVLGVRHLEDDATRAEMAVERDALIVRFLDRSSGAERRTLRIPLHPDGSAWADFCGVRGEWGHRGDRFFVQRPLIRYVEYYDLKWDQFYAKARAVGDYLREYFPDDLPEWVDPLLRAQALREAALRSPEVPLSRVLELEEKLTTLVEAAIAEVPSILNAKRKSAERLRPQFREEILARLDWLGKLHRLVTDQQQDIRRFHALLAPDVRGRTCLIGATHRHGGDQHATPMDVAAPGVEVQITAANMILTGRFLRTAPAWVLGLGMLVAGVFVAWIVTYRSALSGGVTAVLLAGAAAGGYLLALDRFDFVLSAPGPMASVAFAFASSLLYRQLITLRAQKRLQRELESKMSPEVVKAFLENPEVFSRPRRIAGTVFFSDVKGFTSISEKMTAEQLVAFINRYLDRMTGILKAHTGYIDKYIGDGIMALFGAPMEDSRHALRACGAALACQRELETLNAELRRDGLPMLSIRVGLHSGELVSAKIGSLARADLTAMGDTVNLASRLEGANKYYGTGIMISEATWTMVEGQFQARELDTVRVVGKEKAVRVFELLAAAGKPSPLSPEFMAAYELGLDAFKERRWTEAARHFGAARALRPNDGPCRLYLQRCAANQLNEPPADWLPIHTLESK